jgi:hypothetical protein
MSCQKRTQQDRETDQGRSQAACSQSEQGCEDRIEIAVSACLNDLKPHSKGAGSRLRVFDKDIGIGTLG